MNSKRFTTTNASYGTKDFKTLELFDNTVNNVCKAADLMPCPRRPPKGKWIKIKWNINLDRLVNINCFLYNLIIISHFCTFLIWEMNHLWLRASSNEILLRGSFYKSFVIRSFTLSLMLFQQGKSKINLSSRVILIVSFWDSWSNGKEPDNMA